MSKAHIDKVFEQKLAEHRSEPPVGAWDKLEAQLDEKKRKKAVVWYQVAAAVAILLVGGWFVLRTPQMQTGNTVAEVSTTNTHEEEEVQNRLAEATGRTNEEEEVQNLVAQAPTRTNEEEEVQNIVTSSPVAGISAGIAKNAVSPTADRPTIQNLAPLPSIRITPELGVVSNQEVAVAIAPVALPERPHLLFEGELLPEDLSWNDAVALVKNVKEGDVTIGQIREAKDKFSLDQVSWASLREAKNELLSFND